jgi:EAL and modified HD-GYP domain-containing signal transduction protein
VARHPILDRDRKVFGYDLSFQALPGAGPETAPADYATAHVISDGVLAIGLDTLVDGKKAFVNVGRNLLLEGIPAVLPPSKVVIELSADVEADAEVVAACRQLREQGYAISVDDFVLNEWTADLMSFASFLKVDLTAPVDPELRARLDTDRGAHAVSLVATKVETFDTFERASRDGYRYFQGFFFGRPLLLQGRGVPGQKLASMRLLQALNDPDLSVHQLEALIKHDAALSYRILRTVNSAAFARQTTVSSMREALLLLGRDTVRRWASLWALAGLGEGAHSELMTLSIVRARCCEVLASSRGEEAAAEGFLVGMCSLLDAILQRPMEAVLADLPLADETRKALMGEDNATRRLLDCAVAYERGDWAQCTALAERASIKLSALPIAFADALRWSRELRGAGD